MTDLLNGRIDFFGYEINPNTTLDEFEKNIGSHFSKRENPKDTEIVNYYLNGDIGILQFNPDDFSTVYSLYDMNFVNVLIVFVKEKIWHIELITDMVSFDFDESGKKIWSDEKRKTRFKILNEWAIKNIGEPTFKMKSCMWYDLMWGKLQPSPYDDSGNAKLYIEYKK